MKRTIASLLIGAMAISLVACGSTATTETAPAAVEEKTEEAAPAAAEETTEEVAEASGDAIDLTMWCIATESD